MKRVRRTVMRIQKGSRLAGRKPAVTRPSRPSKPLPPSAGVESPTENLTPVAPFFMVGVGASAGGLDALAKFFGSIGKSSGLAYIVVQHLSPDHKSFMVELLSRRTEIPVHRAEDGQKVEADHVYLIPPGKNLAIRKGRLRLSEPGHERGLNMPIDVLLRSLAEEQRHRAIAVILSGTGSDGTMGVRAVKDAGGMVMVQSESTAQFAGMPRSAIGTGLADFVLAPEAMSQQLLQYVQHPFVARDQALSRDQSTTEALMQKIFRVLRERCGVDFSQYKPATIDRRIERRMSINQIHNLGDYLAVLQGSAREAGLLFNEFLISVTRFFRDRAAWEFLGTQILPGIFDRAGEDRSIRVWTPACATGEEAYSLAMQLADEAARREGQWDIKVFATDLSRDVYETASAGLYPESVVADVPPALLKRHFDRRDEGYQVRDHLRKMVVFARHDLLKDPPFTKLDLVSCRNVLIYFQPEMQARVISLLHFSLKPDGVLFLGSSETLGDQADLFETLSVRHKLYKNRPGSRARRLQFALQPLAVDAVARQPASVRSARALIDFGALEQIYRDVLADYAAACFVIDEHNEILHLLGRAGDYLRQPSGMFTNNLLRLTAHNLSSALATALHKAEKESGDFTYDNVRLRVGEENRVLRLRIKTISLGGRGVVRLVLVEEKRSRSRDRTENFELDKSAVQRIADLDQELTYTKESLQATIEELETANEELQATNEELLASNEELQSTNEELQSVNEELHTVNTENQNRIDELAELNNDIDNLLAASYVGTMLVDPTLRIRRLSATTQQLTGLTHEDVNAPLEVLARLLPSADLIPLAQKVLDEHKPRELEVSVGRRFLLLRLAPYRTSSSETRGLVVTVIDITQRRAAEDALRASEALTRCILDAIGAHVAVIDQSGLIVQVNEPWRRFAEANEGRHDPALGVGANYFEVCERAIITTEGEAGRVLEGLRDTIAGKRKEFRAEYACHSPTEQRWFLLHGSPLAGGAGLVIAHYNITERKIAEAERLQWERRLQETQKLESLGVLAGGLAHDFNNLLSSILGNTGILESELPPASEASRRLEPIKKAVQRAADLCKQMLAYAGKGQFSIRPANLNGIVNETVELIRVSISDRADLHFQLATDQPLVLADATQVRQIVMNLILNASDALGERGGQITISTGVMEAGPEYLRDARLFTELKAGRFVYLEVSDTGCGMSDETLARIFEPFFSTKFIGRGLGLSAVAGIVRRHRGALHVKSAPGQGSVFRVLLPAGPGGDVAPATRRDGTVLVIDDEPAVGAVVGKMLRTLGYSPVIASNARDGLARFSEKSDEIIFVMLDLTLVHLDGAQPFRELLGIHPEVPVLLMSSLDEHDTRQRMRGLDVAGYISKPFDARTLRKRLEEILPQSRSS